MEKKKNFKCLNKSCGVSYTAESLGPCPVCGNEDTKLDKNRKLLCILLWAGLPVLISMGIWIIVFSPVNDSDNVVNTPPINDPNSDDPNPGTVFECDISYLDVYEVECISENKVKIKTSGYHPDSCGNLKFSINDGGVSSSNILIVDPSNIDLRIYIYNDNGDKIKTCNDFENPCYKPDSTPSDSDKDDFKENFKRYVADPKNNVGLIEKLKDLATSLGIRNDKINAKFDGNIERLTIEDLLSKITADCSLMNKKYDITSEFEFSDPPKVELQKK
jgi:hypothetical protein